MAKSQTPAQDILKILETIANRSGGWCDEVFDDFIQASIHALLMGPLHTRALERTGKAAKDDADTAAFFAKVRDRYGAEGMRSFAHGLAILRAECSDDLEYRDLLGETYMMIRSSGKGRILGQHFTPSALAMAMALMTVHDLATVVGKRLHEAGAASGFNQAQCRRLAEGFTDAASYREWEVLAKAMGLHFTSVRVGEPSCGSGALMLAIAQRCPRWAIETGCVVFHANDLDRLCASMCLLNMLLHGLTGVVTQGDALRVDPPTAIGWSPAGLHHHRKNLPPAGSATDGPDSFGIMPQTAAFD